MDQEPDEQTRPVAPPSYPDPRDETDAESFPASDPPSETIPAE
jgi:hypothetical protein